MYLSVKLKMSIDHLDVTTAFLNGFLKETIYMPIPDEQKWGKGFEIKTSYLWIKTIFSCMVWKLKTCFLTWISKIVSMSLVCSQKHVDHFLIFSNNSVETDNLKRVLGAEFKSKDLVPVR